MKPSPMPLNMLLQEGTMERSLIAIDHISNQKILLSITEITGASFPTDIFILQDRRLPGMELAAGPSPIHLGGKLQN